MNQQVLRAKALMESLGYKVTKINEEESVSHGKKFKVGDVFEYTGLYGGSYTCKITDIKGDKVKVETSWTSEDTGDTVTDKDTFYLEKDPEGNECIIVWEYRGEYGYVYPPKDVNESADGEDVQWGVHQFSTDSIIFRGTEEECGKYIDKDKSLWDDAEVYRMTPDDPHYMRESSDEDTTEEDVVSKVKSALDDAGIEYRVRGKSSLVVRKQDLRKASEIRAELDPKSIVHVASLA